jgi:hypothetical protein
MGVIWEGAYNKVTFLRSFVQALEALCDEELGAYNEADPAAGGSPGRRCHFARERRQQHHCVNP